MNLQEIFKAHGIEDDVSTKILTDMKSNKIFTASEDNLDIRYGKLKGEHDTSKKTIEELQSQIAAFEQLKSQNAALAEEASKKYAALEAENVKIKTDYALERALMEAKVNDVDYVKYKLKEKHIDGFKLDENGKIDGINTMLDDMKIQLPNQFSKTDKKIDEKKLEKGDDDNLGVTVEQFNKMNYHERAKLFQENPEQYKELNNSKGE